MRHQRHDPAAPERQPARPRRSPRRGAGGAGSADSQLAPTRLETKRPSRSAAGRNAAIRVTRRFSASAERVFDAWLDPEVAGRWLFATALQPMTEVEIDARARGVFCFAARRGAAAS